MTISAIIPHYYPARRRLLPIICAALNGGTVPPVEIIIWNDELVSLDNLNLPKNVVFVQPHRNIGSKGRYVAALAAKGDYLLFHDNDMAVQPRTLEQFLVYATPNIVMSLEGRQVMCEFHGPMSRKNRLNGLGLSKPMPVDIPHSEISMSHYSLVNRLMGGFAITEDSTEMDDICYAATAKHAGVARVVIPFGPDSGFVRLDECGVGMWKDPHFYDKRDALVRAEWPERFSTDKLVPYA